MVSYTKAATERAMKVQGGTLTAICDPTLAKRLRW